MTQLIITKAKLVFPNIYKARELNLPGFKTHFGLGFTAEDTFDILKKYRVYPNHKGLYNARSNFAPLVSPFSIDGGSYDLFLKAFEIAKARNMSLDVALRDLDAELIVSTFDYETKEYEGTGLSLDEVRIAPELLLKNVLTFTRQGKKASDYERV